MSDYKHVMKSIQRTDGELIVTGRAQYTVDIELPGMLYAKILRSPYPHARVKEIRTERAKAFEGVKAVITGKEIGYRRFSFIDTPAYPADETPLAVDKVRFIGEGVAAVAAINEEVACKALALIEVEYEELPAVFDPEEALQDGAPAVHDVIEPNNTTAWEDFGIPKKLRPYRVDNNISNKTLIEDGNIETGFKEADYIREDRFVIPATSHVAMEPHVAVANFQPNEKLDVWLTHMGYEHKRFWLGKLLDIPLSRVRVHKTYVGGAFGGKLSPFPYEFVAAFLSRLTLRPVKITLSRDEVFSVCPPSRRMIITVKTGVKREGKITAQHVKVIDDAGAYRNSSPTAMYLAPALISLNASVCLISKEGEQEIPLETIFTGNGSTPFSLHRGELLKEVIIPSSKTIGGYRKLRMRNSIDYPLASVAFSSNKAEQGRLVVGAVSPHPLSYEFLSYRQLKELFEKAYDDAAPVGNMPLSPLYRKWMIRVFVQELLKSIM